MAWAYEYYPNQLTFDEDISGSKTQSMDHVIKPVSSSLLVRFYTRPHVLFIAVLLFGQSHNPSPPAGLWLPLIRTRTGTQNAICKSAASKTTNELSGHISPPNSPAPAILAFASAVKRVLICHQQAVGLVIPGQAKSCVGQVEATTCSEQEHHKAEKCSVASSE
ncbi:hypothetical protein WISP_59708 [Willisornis vidua]|uniref:Uncharacterized protein n=1 Tax=Willisornis vidua TaxID=1566151 RepID=A0ABQ9DB33_9PASS|nr:hypothetical protein WISP_59708 [Willisornis vidua]